MKTFLSLLPSDIEQLIWKNVFDECLQHIAPTFDKVMMKKSDKYICELRRIKHEYVAKVWKHAKGYVGMIFQDWKLMLEKVKSDDNTLYYEVIEMQDYVRFYRNLTVELSNYGGKSINEII